MDTRTGKKIRLGRLFGAHGRSLIVAYSHGVLMGPLPGMRNGQEMATFAASMGLADGLMVAPGMVTLLESAFVGRQAPALVVHLDWQNFSRRTLPNREGLCAPLAEIEHVVAAGADAIMTYLFVGHADPHDEREEVARNARLARECERWGLPLLIEPRSAREKEHPEDKSDPAIMAMYCRIAAEIGADLVKCIDPGNRDALEQITDGCPVPVLVAGGARRERLADGVEAATRAMRAGAAGLVFGRNIYQAEDPGAALAAFRRVVDETPASRVASVIGEGQDRSVRGGFDGDA